MRLRLPERLADAVPTAVTEFAVGIAAAIVFTIVRFGVEPLTGSQAPFSLVFVAVLFACLVGGWRSGLLALVVGQALAWFYFLEPTRSFRVTSPQAISGLALASLAQVLIVLLMGLYQREIGKASHAVQEEVRLRDELIAELNHRVKNTLAIVQSIAYQSLTDAKSQSEARQAFEGRLQALAAAHRLLTENLWQACKLSEVISESLKPHDNTGNRFLVDATELPVSPKTAVTLVMTLHELATNATKYGALRAEDGQVRIDARMTADRFTFSWAEVGGSPVSAPVTRGFGTRMLERALSSELGGSAALEFQPVGLRYLVEAPARTPL